jgi:aminopeptidase S
MTSEAASGTWTLVLYDAYAQDTGTLSSWSLTV